METATLAEAPAPTANKSKKTRAPKRSEDQQIRDLQEKIAELEERKAFKGFAKTKVGAKLRNAIANLRYIARHAKGDGELAAAAAETSHTLERLVAARLNVQKPEEPTPPGFE
jgi:hypothetical protein